MKPDARTRLTLVDGMRGLAACAVMLYHYTSGPLRPTLLEFLPWPVFGLLGHGWLGVHVFFVLSGFVIAYAIGERKVTARGAGLFVLRRQVRLDPPYWASIAFAAGMAWHYKIKYGGNHMAPSAGDILGQVLYVQTILGGRPVQAVYWSLAIEVQFYLVFVALLALWGATPKVRAWRAFPAWACAVTGAWSVDTMVHWRITAEWLAPNWYLFAVGACTYWTLAGRFPKWALLTGLLALAWEGWRTEFLEPCAGAAVAGVLYLAGRRGTLSTWMKGRVWQWLGRMSYTIYLLHTVVGGMTRGHLGRRVRDAEPIGALVVMVAAVSASLLAAWLLHVLVEKPAMRWAAKIRWAEDAPKAT